MNTTRYWATIEFLPGQSAAIIELTLNGEWAGGGRIELPRNHSGSVRDALYEAGYVHASARAALKGGTLDRYSEWEAPRPDLPASPPRSPTGRCLHSPLLSNDWQRRGGNALNVEIGEPLARCLQKQPEEWRGRGMSSLRWLASGGSPLVFGPCTPRACALHDRINAIASVNAAVSIAREEGR